MLLNQLKNNDIRYIKGVGEKKALLFQKLNIFNVYDLLTFYPFRYEDRTALKKIKDIIPGQIQTVIGRVVGHDHFRIRGRRTILKIFIGDDTGFFSLICYNRNFLKDILKKEMKVFISSSKFIYKYNELQTADFEYEIIDDDNDTSNIHTNRIVPIYHSTENLSNKFVRVLVYRELKKIIDDIEDAVPSELLHKYKLPDFNLCLYKMHFPSDMSELELVRRRLAFDRFFFLELVLALNKRNITLTDKKQKYTKKVLMNKFCENLKFTLTTDQKNVLKEILTDMNASKCMNRLLMGDVGSGKTIVALISSLVAAENKIQVAFMVPTEILALQHYTNIKEFLKDYNVQVELLVGNQKIKERAEVLESIRTGSADLIIGTHALIEENVQFNDLGYIVIDEQHRFGVLQRAKMHLKAPSPDVLVMTATPIPRTLSLTVYGDLDISVIREMPPGRKVIKTLHFYEKRVNEVYDFLRKEMLQSHQVYVVYPLVKESEKMDLKDAQSMYLNFRDHIFKDFNTGLIHGKMKKEEKERIMNEFRKGHIDLLVSTTVIEVGVDVANASVMVVEHAERFGIAQLHQLRGRIGRGDIASTCILITGYGLSEEGRKRMNALVKYNDGFKLAEIDLELRGPGELMGTKQTGLPDLKPANLIEDRKILETSREEAFRIVDKDPQLKAHPVVAEYLKNDNFKELNLIKVS
ncbi:MAG: ATP-dependent DNA helicase RecG [Spirochaetes bacterium]|nr:ATP-dependent DNA helicase RecG [Spirochaetota bacterium]